ncbi:hypothetical protein GDO78_022994 [Eleutherodactylus coqui]|uniref:Uncharacterized protein n=1 Tax=Eleutherodactylus coqui TaxID=57060 RepID=A0A8J6E9C8_ELECQ|nr:hypothetical protein GDO78_022994 [Eleutherodactylus coqui]
MGSKNKDLGLALKERSRLRQICLRWKYYWLSGSWDDGNSCAWRGYTICVSQKPWKLCNSLSYAVSAILDHHVLRDPPLGPAPK